MVNKIQQEDIEQLEYKTINGNSILWTGDIVVSWTWDMTKSVYDTKNRQQDIYQYARRIALIY